MRQIDFDKTILRNPGWVIVLAVVLLVSATMAESGGDYDLSWSTIDGGGGRF